MQNIQNAILKTEIKSDDDIGNKFTFKGNIVTTSGKGNKCLLNAFFCAALDDADRNRGVMEYDDFCAFGNIIKVNLFGLSHYPQVEHIGLVKKVLFKDQNSLEYQNFGKIYQLALTAAENATVTVEELTNFHHSSALSLNPNQSIEFDAAKKKFYICEASKSPVELNQLSSLDNFVHHTLTSHTWDKIVKERKENVIYKAILQYFLEICNTKNEAKKLLGQDAGEQATGLANLENALQNDAMLEATSAGALLSYISGKKLNIFSQSPDNVNNQGKIGVSIFDDNGQQKTAKVDRFNIENGRVYNNGTEIDKNIFLQAVIEGSKNSFFKKVQYVNNSLPSFDAIQPIHPDDLDIDGMIGDTTNKYMIEISQNLLTLPDNQAILGNKNAVNLFHKGLHYQALTKAPKIEIAKQVAAVQKSGDPLIIAAKLHLKGLLDAVLSSTLTPLTTYKGKQLSGGFSAADVGECLCFHSLDENQDILKDIKTLLGDNVKFYQYNADTEVTDFTTNARLSKQDSKKLMDLVNKKEVPNIIITPPNPPITQPNPITTQPPKTVSQYTQTIDLKKSQYAGYNLYKINDDKKSAIRVKASNTWTHKAIVDEMLSIFKTAVKEARGVEDVDQDALKDPNFLAVVVQFAQAKGGVARVANAVDAWKASPLVPVNYRSEKYFHTAKAVSGEYQLAAEATLKTGREERLKLESVSARLFRTPAEFADRIKNTNFSGQSK